MANVTAQVTELEIEELLALRAQGLTKREISELSGRSTRTLDRYLPQVRPGAKRYDPTKHLTAYKAALPNRTNERKHLQALYDANGYGFSWWPPSLMERVYLLETAQPRREFWRAA